MTDSLSLSYDQTRELIDDLFNWSQNFDFPTPASLFLDLIGYSEEEFGERLCGDRLPPLGYKEHHVLGWALLAYAHRPSDALEQVVELLAAEAE